MHAHLKWLKANGWNLAPLTGQDSRTLTAIDACWELYGNSDRNGQEGALSSVTALLPAMQRKCWPMAIELVARHLDWGARERVALALEGRLGEPHDELWQWKHATQVQRNAEAKRTFDGLKGL